MTLMADQKPIAIQTLSWCPVTETAPPAYESVFLYRAGDLAPVTGWRTLGNPAAWILEEGGSEDDDRRRYWQLLWTPTHFASLDGADLPMAAPPCPGCGEPLREVLRPAGSMLNDDQFDSLTVGDWYCEGCPERPERSAISGYAYYGDDEVTP
jgi:hypothetical protein